MAQSDLTRVIEPACQKLAEQHGFELVDVELVREGASRYLRIYIDKPDGITWSDCETYHRAVTPLVERVDYDFPEVCSPGLDRPLKSRRILTSMRAKRWKSTCSARWSGASSLRASWLA